MITGSIKITADKKAIICMLFRYEILQTISRPSEILFLTRRHMQGSLTLFIVSNEKITTLSDDSYRIINTEIYDFILLKG